MTQTKKLINRIGYLIIISILTIGVLIPTNSSYALTEPNYLPHDEIITYDGKFYVAEIEEIVRKLCKENPMFTYEYNRQYLYGDNFTISFYNIINLPNGSQEQGIKYQFIKLNNDDTFYTFFESVPFTFYMQGSTGSAEYWGYKRNYLNTDNTTSNVKYLSLLQGKNVNYYNPEIEIDTGKTEIIAQITNVYNEILEMGGTAEQGNIAIINILNSIYDRMIYEGQTVAETNSLMFEILQNIENILNENTENNKKIEEALEEITGKTIDEIIEDTKDIKDIADSKVIDNDTSNDTLTILSLMGGLTAFNSILTIGGILLVVLALAKKGMS